MMEKLWINADPGPVKLLPMADELINPVKLSLFQQDMRINGGRCSGSYQN